MAKVPLIHPVQIFKRLMSQFPRVPIKTLEKYYILRKDGKISGVWASGGLRILLSLGLRFHGFPECNLDIPKPPGFSRFLGNQVCLPRVNLAIDTDKVGWLLAGNVNPPHSENYNLIKPQIYRLPETV